MRSGNGKAILRRTMAGALGVLWLLAVAGAAHAHGPGDESPDMADPGTADRGGDGGSFVSALVSRELARARALLDQGRYREAIGQLEAMDARSRAYNRYENAVLHQTLGYAYASADEYAKAAGAFAEALSFKALPEETTLAVMENLGQLYIATEQYDRGIATLEAWMGRARPARIAPQVRVLLGNAYFRRKDYAKAAAQVRRAIADVQRADRSWYQLLAGIEQQWGHYGDMAGALQQAVAAYPDEKAFWQQLAAAYRLHHEEGKAAAVLALACRRGVCGTEDKVYLARLYLFLGVPLKAAQVLWDALKDKTLAAGAEPWTLLGQSWRQAREPDRAERAYREAVRRSKADGNAGYALGQLYVQQEKWQAAADAFAAALQQGHLSQPGRARLLLGVSQWYLGHGRAAAAALEAARRDPEVKAEAGRWLAQVRQSANPIRDPRRDPPGPAGPAGTKTPPRPLP